MGQAFDRLFPEVAELAEAVAEWPKFVFFGGSE
jgi:hypothetical protein